MQRLVISPTCNFPSISQMAYIVQSDQVLIETHENYQKRTCRNRYSLVNHHGLKTMSIPLKKGKNEQLPISQVKIANETNWQLQQLRTIKAAYGKSPYFEFYFDQLNELFYRNHNYLIDFNWDCLHFFMKCAQTRKEIKETVDYIKDYENGVDLRYQIPDIIDLPYYAQVFEDRLQFIPNASVLDLLLCCGPASGSYLMSIKIAT